MVAFFPIIRSTSRALPPLPREQYSEALSDKSGERAGVSGSKSTSNRNPLTLTLSPASARAGVGKSLAGERELCAWLTGANALRLTIALVLLSIAPIHAQEASFTRTVRPFLNTYCLKCHGKAEQEGDRRFDTLAGAISDDASLVDYQDILDQLNLAEMPPEGEKQPTIDERRGTIEFLTKRIADYHKSRTDSGGRTTLRRLNSREYRNTIRDLLKLDMTMFDPTSDFPKDQTVEHLDNNGEALVTSGYLLQRYLAAADKAVTRALHPLKKPKERTWKFTDNFRQQPEIDQVHRKTSKFKWITLYDVPGADKPEGAYSHIHDFSHGVPADGDYEIRFQAEALNREHPYDPKIVGTDATEPFRLGIVPGDHTVGHLHTPQPIQPLLAEFELADEKQWYTARVRLDEGFTPRFTFPNGMMDSRNLWTRLTRKQRDMFPGLKNAKPGIVSARFNAIKEGKLPQIRIHEVQIRGPLFVDWPTASQKALLGEDCDSVLRTGKLSEQTTRNQLTQFATRAFRRPARSGEIDRVMKIVAARRKSGRTSLEAFADGVTAILISPNFVYLNASADGNPDAYVLASRLSYFLWSTKPDEVLLHLAANEQLAETDVIKQQLNRMLADDRSNAFVNDFLDSWLTLRDLGSQPPDRATFRDYYRYDLGTAMRRETELFTRHLLDENLPLRNFLDSDFTFVNKRLAKHYRIDAPPDHRFAKVPLNDKRRGGLLGHGSVLTVTANGIDTSPIVRGVWLLENILGTPPSPPPPDVEPLDPDTRGAKTIRDQLRKHRDTPSCYSCHRKIDPLGFALENFDPIGRWRANYPRGRKVGAKVDASGELPGGRKFKDIRGLKKLLLAQEDQFTRALTEKIVAYALGRRVSVVDRPQIDAILKRLKSRGGGFRDLIELVVLSDLFRR